MCSHKTLLPMILGGVFCVSAMSGALAVEDPNGDYSSLVLSYRNSTFATPLCVGNECHSGVAGPSITFSHQLIPNFAFGLSGSSLQSKGVTSTVESSGGAVFLEGIAGIGSFVDVGAIVAVLSSSTQICTTNPSVCASTDDTGTDAGIFGMAFLDEMKSVSITLGYDSIQYQKSADQSVVSFSLVTILAEHHRLAFSADRSQYANGNRISDGFGFGYSYIF